MPLFHQLFEHIKSKSLVGRLYQTAIIYSLCDILLGYLHSTEPDIRKVGVFLLKLTAHFCTPHWYLHELRSPSNLLFKL